MEQSKWEPSRPAAVTLCQPSASPTSPSSKAKRHSPLRFVQCWRRNCGRGYSGRGTVFTGALPFHEANAGRRGNIAGRRARMVRERSFPGSPTPARTTGADRDRWRSYQREVGAWSWDCAAPSPGGANLRRVAAIRTPRRTQPGRARGAAGGGGGGGGGGRGGGGG